MKKKVMKTDGVMMNVQRLLKNAPIFPRNVARAYISFPVDEHRKTSANTLYVNFNAKDGDHMQIYYVETGEGIQVCLDSLSVWLILPC